MTWRDRFKPIIREVIQETGTDDMRLLRQKLRDAFPAGPRQYHPYKIWLDEINRQLGLGKHKRSELIAQEKKHFEPLEGQQELF